MEHDFENETEEYLAHYGVPGMKWGVRKSNPKSSSDRISRIKRRAKSTANRIKKKYKQGTKKERLKKMATMTTKELNDVSNRIDAERRYMNATKPDYLKTAAKYGGMIVSGVLIASANEIAKDYVKAYANAGLKAVGITKPFGNGKK